MKFRLAIVVLLVSAGWLAGRPIFAQSLPDPLAASLRNCAKEADAAQRLACYDALTAKLPAVQADQFGMTHDIAKKRDPVATEQKQHETLQAKIGALTQTSDGRYVFTLDNGQVWLQKETQPNVTFAVGDAVQIEHGAMGSLWLAADSHRMTRVRRVK